MQIPLEITWRGLERTPTVEAEVRKWVAKLEAIYDRITRCSVAIESPHRHHRRGKQYHVRVVLTVPGGETIAVSRDPGPDEEHADVYVAISHTFHAARRRLEDHVRRRLQADVGEHVGPEHGRVVFLDVEREWGLLETPEGRRVYFHRNSVVGDPDELRLGDEVRFAEEGGDKGPQASSVTRVGRHGQHELPHD